MDFPLVKIDATELNPTGASGGIKKKDFINKIVEKAKDMMEMFPDKYFSFDGTISQIIVFVDEIDKLGQSLSNDWNIHVQSNFLTLFENKGELSDVTFIFAGAFAGIEKYSQKINNIGFSNASSNKTDINLTAEIIKTGMLPELVGRLQHIVLLDELRLQDYKKILLELILPNIKDSLYYFDIDNFTLTEDQIHKLSNEALKSKLGVRYLMSGISKIITEIEFDPDSYGDHYE